MSTIKETRQAYIRFIDNYKNEDTGGLNLYPQFSQDLETILDFVGVEFIGLDEVFE